MFPIKFIKNLSGTWTLKISVDSFLIKNGLTNLIRLVNF